MNQSLYEVIYWDYAKEDDKDRNESKEAYCIIYLIKKNLEKETS